MKSFHVTTIKNVFQEPKDMHILKKKRCSDIYVFVKSSSVNYTVSCDVVSQCWEPLNKTKTNSASSALIHSFLLFRLYHGTLADVCRCCPTRTSWNLKLKVSPRIHFFCLFFFLLVSFCKCLYVHLYIQKTIWNCFKMWKIFSEIKMWCNPKRRKRSVFYHNLFWILITRWDHRDLDGWHNILAEPSILCPSPHFHPHVFPSLSSLPSPAFISSDTTYPGLDFRLKTKHGLRGGQKKHPRTQREGGPQANWQLGVKVSLSPPCSYSFTLFFALFLPFLFLLWTSPFEEKLNIRPHSCMLEWGENKPQSWLKTVKTHRSL